MIGAGSAGGAITNSGNLTLNNDTFNNNTITTTSGEIDGGAIYSDGTLTVNTSQFTNNTIAASAGWGYGAAISMPTSGTASASTSIANSTFSGNSISSSQYAIGIIFVRAGQTLNITGSTFSNNSGDAIYESFSPTAVTVSASTFSGNTGAGIVSSPGGPLTVTSSTFASNSTGISNPESTSTFILKDSIVAGNTTDISGKVTSGTSNLIGVGTSSTDQRGNTRPGGTSNDIGAFQSAGFNISATSGGNQNAITRTAYGSSLVTTVTPITTGEPVAGGVVTFVGPGSGASGTLSTTTTAGAVPTNAATFSRLDTIDQGSWRGVYGTDGYYLGTTAGISIPGYSSIAITGNSYIDWSGSTTDVRAPQYPTGSNRMVPVWFSSSNFSIALSNTDTLVHQVALYALDWDGNNVRSETIQAIDAATGVVLASQALTSFSSGV